MYIFLEMPVLLYLSATLAIALILIRACCHNVADLLSLKVHLNSRLSSKIAIPL